jgi:orotidine-5'-phosphate decarboxylase
MAHFADRLVAAVRAKRNALCVGLDPRWDTLPRNIRTRHGAENLETIAAAFEEFCYRVIDIVAPVVAVVKPQSAFFEACGPAGFAAQQRLLQRARELGVMTILDAKRNDIASTAAAYADAAFGGMESEGETHLVWDADALTVSPYLGRDSIEPFLTSGRRTSRGVFLLVRTSNPGARQFQDLECNGQPLYLHVAAAVREWTRENLGESGYGDVGAVIGATYPVELSELRRLMPEVIFLVPGFGAQGGTAGDVAAAFHSDGSGAIVNSSRGITCSFDSDDPRWEDAIATATNATIQMLRDATPMGKFTSSSSQFA